MVRLLWRFIASLACLMITYCLLSIELLLEKEPNNMQAKSLGALIAKDVQKGTSLRSITVSVPR
jgi:hypothetical protein